MIFPKIVFPPFSATILNFCIKIKKAYISETLHFCIIENPIKQRNLVVSTQSLILIGTLCFCFAKTISFSLAKQYSSCSLHLDMFFTLLNQNFLNKIAYNDSVEVKKTSYFISSDI